MVPQPDLKDSSFKFVAGIEGKLFLRCRSSDGTGHENNILCRTTGDGAVLEETGVVGRQLNGVKESSR